MVCFLCELLRQDWESEGEDGLHQGGAVRGVAGRTAEAVALQVGHRRRDGGGVRHVGGGAHQDVRTFLARPVARRQNRNLLSYKQVPNCLASFILYLAKSQHCANVLLENKVVVDAACHVTEPHVEDAGAVQLGRQLRADHRVQNLQLLPDTASEMSSYNAFSVWRTFRQIIGVRPAWRPRPGTPGR